MLACCPADGPDTPMTTTRDTLDSILARLAARSAEERVFLRVYEASARAAAS